MLSYPSIDRMEAYRGQVMNGILDKVQFIVDLVGLLTDQEVISLVPESLIWINNLAVGINLARVVKAIIARKNL